MIYLNNIEIKQDHFPDGTAHPIIPSEVVQDIRENCCVSWFYENDSELFTLICLKDWLDNDGRYEEVTLLMPYVPHARMDRVKRSTDVFTLKSFCHIINNLNFDRVYGFDSHSNVAPALLDHYMEYNITRTVKTAIQESNAEVLFFPDEGASKRYNAMFDMPSTFGVKDRDWGTGRINSLILMNPEIIKGKRVLIVDDICSYGGTFHRAAKALLEAGATEVSLYVSHCEKNILKGSLYVEEQTVKNVYTTDSLLEEPIADNMYFVGHFRT